MGKDTGLTLDENADAIKIVTSATAAIRGVLSFGTEVLEEHKKGLISKMLWKITEANGKYNTRYYSERALKADNSDKRHDHVCTRKRMIERILANPNGLDVEIRQAIGCVVTKAEHNELTKYDDKYDGWDRYKQAKIKVWDGKERRWN